MFELVTFYIPLSVGEPSELGLGVGDTDNAHCPWWNHDEAGDVFVDNQFVALHRVFVLIFRVVDEEDITVVRSRADNSLKALGGRQDRYPRPRGCLGNGTTMSL